jgi:hypothetical protein
VETHCERPESIDCDPSTSRSELTGLAEDSAVRPPEPSFTNLLDALTQRVVARSGRQLARLEVSVENGTVKATGIAYSFYAKQLVTHTLLNGAPHLEILNCLRVEPWRLDCD